MKTSVVLKNKSNKLGDFHLLLPKRCIEGKMKVIDQILTINNKEGGPGYLAIITCFQI